ncbi:hypothetical protein EI94DRAFT_1893738 [Lactarius quietus]|nr:hypothetical protein EI94DRAFT_1893738 [Lactarius quietus]
MPSTRRLDLKRECTRLILYNVQSFTTPQIWRELSECLGHMIEAVVKIKRVSGLNRHPHADLWVRKDRASQLLSLIRERTKIPASHSDVKEEEMLVEMPAESTLPPRDDARSSRVQGWRLALWQPWRERRLKPAKPQLERLSRRPPTSIVTYNSNGFWSKQVEIDELLIEENVAVLALQETLVSARHYPVHMHGYRAYVSNAKEDFRGIALLVDNRYASYEVPHGVHWLLHVKVFNYAGLDGPIHIINVYLKSGGNHRSTRREQLTVVKGIVAKIIERDADSRVVVLGDMNEPEKALVHHLNIVGNKRNYLFPAHFVGNRHTHFPLRGEPSAIDNILLTETSQRLFRGARVLRCYNSSDHRLVVMTPYVDIIAAAAREKRPTRASFDTKMLYLKGDLIANDNAWSKLMQQAYGEMSTDGDPEAIATDELRAEVSTKANEPGSNQEFPKKLKLLQQTVHRYSKRYHAALDCNRTPNESTFIRLARAQTRFKKEKKAWQCRMRQKFYAGVAGDFIANDHKRVWSKLRSQTKPNSVVETVNPVKDSEGVLQYHADKILQAMKDHYEELLTYDPDGWTSNCEYWDGLDLGEQGVEMTDLNDGLDWPEVLFTIRGMNRNTAPGKDEVHINVLKIMVREECMAALSKENPKFVRPDTVYVDLPEKEVKRLLMFPLTNLGKSFHALLTRTWQSGCIPEQWQCHDSNNRWFDLNPKAFLVSPLSQAHGLQPRKYARRANNHRRSPYTSSLEDNS